MRINKVRKINFMHGKMWAGGTWQNVKRKFLIYMNMQISQLNELYETEAGRQSVRLEGWKAGPHMINNAVNFNENSMENSNGRKNC